MSEKKLGIDDVLRTLSGEGGPTPSEPPQASPVESTIRSTGSVIEDLGRIAGPSAGLRELAYEAARAADESRAAGAKASVLKQELLARMQKEKIKEVQLNDRNPIKIGESRDKAKTLKALKEIEGVEGWDEDKAKEIWAALPVTKKPTVEIPMPRIEPPEEPE